MLTIQLHLIKVILKVSVPFCIVNEAMSLWTRGRATSSYIFLKEKFLTARRNWPGTYFVDQCRRIRRHSKGRNRDAYASAAIDPTTVGKNGKGFGSLSYARQGSKFMGRCGRDLNKYLAPLRPAHTQARVCFDKGCIVSTARNGEHALLITRATDGFSCVFPVHSSRIG